MIKEKIKRLLKIKDERSRYQKKVYSQDGEDVVLYSFFEDKPGYKGFYIDIGAHHPYRFSNTQIFYDKGWRGINVDALPNSMKVFDKVRPGDINIEVGISDSGEILKYYSFEEAALNCFSEERANYLIQLGCKCKEIIDIPTIKFSKLIEKYLPKHIQKIDFITMDIEGFELSVLKQFDFSKYAPTFFLIEELDYVDNDFFEYKTSEMYNYLSDKGYGVVAKTYRTVIFKKLR